MDQRSWVRIPATGYLSTHSSVVEHRLYTARVTGSNPVECISFGGLVIVMIFYKYNDSEMVLKRTDFDYVRKNDMDSSCDVRKVAKMFYESSSFSKMCIDDYKGYKVLGSSLYTRTDHTPDCFSVEFGSQNRNNFVVGFSFIDISNSDVASYMQKPPWFDGLVYELLVASSDPLYKGSCIHYLTEGNLSDLDIHDILEDAGKMVYEFIDQL